MSRKALVTEKILGTRGQRRKLDGDFMGGGWTNLVEQAPSGPEGSSAMDSEPSTGEGRSKLVPMTAPMHVPLTIHMHD